MRLFRSLLLLSGCLAVAAPALAQEDQALGVMDRARPDYDAKGLPVGGLRLKPSLDIGAAVDDNVQRSAAAPESDIYFTAAPSFTLGTNWGSSAIELSASITRYQYASLTDENRTDWNIGLSSRSDIWHDMAINSAVSYGLYHEPRNSPDDAGNAATATAFSQLHSEASFEKQADPFGVSIGGSLDRLNYRATPLIGGGVQTNDDRDEKMWSGNAKLAYEVAPGFAVFLRGSYDARQFDTDVAHNSHGYHAVAGSDLFLSHLVRGEVFVGYVNLQFKAPLQSVATIDYGAALHWYVTDLMTFHLTVERDLNDTTIPGASIADDKEFGAALDYELLRNLILQGHADYTDSHFIGTPRSDNIIEAGLNLRYLINPYMAANAGYVWQRRDSNAAGQAFTDNTFTAGLHFQL
jgi:hypothetical protein